MTRVDDIWKRQTGRNDGSAAIEISENNLNLGQD